MDRVQPAAEFNADARTAAHHPAERISRGDMDEFSKEVVSWIGSRIHSNDAYAAAHHIFRTPQEAAERMLSTLPVAAVHDDADWGSAVGPFYTTTSLANWKGVSRQYVHRQMQERRILGMKTADVIVYPSFQFDEKAVPLPHLVEVLSALDPDGRDAWGSALWLNTKARRLDGRSPADLLRAGHLSPVLDWARAAGQVWAS
jgi:hypothetical protein